MAEAQDTGADAREREEADVHELLERLSALKSDYEAANAGRDVRPVGDRTDPRQCRRVCASVVRRIASSWDSAVRENVELVRAAVFSAEAPAREEAPAGPDTPADVRRDAQDRRDLLSSAEDVFGILSRQLSRGLLEPIAQKIEDDCTAACASTLTKDQADCLEQAETFGRMCRCIETAVDDWNKKRRRQQIDVQIEQLERNLRALREEQARSK